MKSIVVGTDFSKGSIVALDLATVIANTINSDILLVWVQQPHGLLQKGPDEGLVSLAKDKLQALCDEYQSKMQRGKIRWDVAYGKVATTIASKARHENAPMIVIGTNGASGFEKYWMGSTGVRIVQEAPCPVLTIREGFDFHKKLEHIIVPIRYNNNSRQKVPPAALMAKVFGANVRLIGLVDDPEEAPLLKIYLDQAQKYLDDKGVSYTTDMREYKNYCDSIIKYAEEQNGDLIVINTEQDKIISQLFLGTDAQQIVHRSQIPVLCIHPEDLITTAARI